MSINKKRVFLFAFIALVIIFFEYSSSSPKAYKLPSSNILHLNKNVFNSYSRTYLINKDLNKYWGFLEEKKLKKNLDKNKTLLDKKTEVKVMQEKDTNVLCVQESCYRLLGIHHEKNRYFATMYNKDFDEKVQDYQTHENLGYGIVIKKIRLHSVEFLDENSTRRWGFKIFDVNKTKYKPKELEK